MKILKWSRSKTKFGKKLEYKNQILDHGDHYSIIKKMYIEGEYKTTDLVQIPKEIINKL